MLTSELVARVRSLGFDDLQDEVILAHLNDVYYDVCSREPWPFLEASASLTVDTTTGKITAPTNIQAILNIIDTTNGRTIVPYRSDDFVQKYVGYLGDTGNAVRYYSQGDSFYLHPVPTGVAYEARYIKVPDELTITPDTTPILPKMHHQILALGALAKAAIAEDDPELSAFYTSSFERRIQSMRQSVWMRQYDRTDYIEDVDWEDYADLDWYG